MRIRHTTVCCSAVALIVLSTCGIRPVLGQSLSLPLFPVRLFWTLPLDAALTAPATFDHGRAYLALDDGRLAAFDLQLGTKTWTAMASTHWKPAVGRGMLFVAEAEGLSARRTSDGTVVWQAPLSGPLAAAPVWDNGWLIVAQESGTIEALRATDGKHIWQQALGAPASAPPSLAADRVYVPLLDNRIVSLAVDTGEVVWERGLGGTPSEVLAPDDRLYVGSRDNFFYCLRADSGEIEWRWRTGGDVVGKAAIDDDLIYFASFDNILRGLDRQSGAQRWKRALPLRSSGDPLLAGGTLIISGMGRALPTFSATNGRPSSTLSVPGELVGPPHLYDVDGMPAMAVITHDIAAGASLLKYQRRIEPEIIPMAPLPNPERVTLPTAS